MTPCRESLPSVTRPKVPSDPTKRPLRLYPAEDFLGRRRVLTILPSESTTVKLMTQSFIVPYLTALVPEQFVPIMPPIFALGPTSLVSLHVDVACVASPGTASSGLCPVCASQAGDLRVDSPGSTGKNSPLPILFNCSFRSCHPMEGCTTMSISSWLNWTIWSI